MSREERRVSSRRSTLEKISESTFRTRFRGMIFPVGGLGKWQEIVDFDVYEKLARNESFEEEFGYDFLVWR